MVPPLSEGFHSQKAMLSHLIITFFMPIMVRILSPFSFKINLKWASSLESGFLGKFYMVRVGAEKGVDVFPFMNRRALLRIWNTYICMELNT